MPEDIDLSDLPKFLTVEEAARVLRVQPETIRRGIRAGRIEAAMIGKGYRITDREIERLAKEGTSPRRQGRKDAFKSKPVSLAAGRVYPGQGTVEDQNVDQGPAVSPDQLALDLARRGPAGDRARRDPGRGVQVRIIG